MNSLNEICGEPVTPETDRRNGYLIKVRSSDLRGESFNDSDGSGSACLKLAVKERQPGLMPARSAVGKA